MNHVSLIYKLLALHLVISEANSMLNRIGLGSYSISSPAQLSGGAGAFAPIAFNGEWRNFDAHIGTTNLTFGLMCGGEREHFHLACLCKLPGGGVVEDWHDRNGEARVPKRSVNDKKAYGLARGWLEQLGFDVHEMEKTNRVRVQHLLRPPVGGGLVTSRFVVRWGGGDITKGGEFPVVEVGLNETEKRPATITARTFAYYRRPIPAIPHAIAVSLLPDEPVIEFLNSNNFSVRTFEFTNAFKLLQTSTEYEAAMQRALLKEASEILSLLGCDQLDEPKTENLTDIYANPPAFGSGGRLEFRNGELRFDCGGKLSYFSFVPRGQTNYNLWKSLSKSLISTNEARQIAFEKLSALSVDVAALDRDYDRKFYQGRFYKTRVSDHKRIWFDTPEYCFEWRSRLYPSRSLVTVVVYGDIRQVGRIELTDTSYWTRRIPAPSNGS